MHEIATSMITHVQIITIYPSHAFAMQWFYYFGIRSTLVKANFSDPFFAEVIGRDREHGHNGPGVGAHQGAAPWLYWGCPESKRLDDVILDH